LRTKIKSTGAGGGEAKVDFRVEYQDWPAGKEFPLTLQEAWYIMLRQV
jgi:hypothetical protein